MLFPNPRPRTRRAVGWWLRLALWLALLALTVAVVAVPSDALRINLATLLITLGLAIAAWRWSAR